MADIVHDETGAPLVCYGCGHSIGGAPYPSGPSGERPCGFCIRNPKLDEAQAYINEKILPLVGGGAYTARYDNGPCQKSPADQYIATDRVMRDVPTGTFVIT